MRSRQLIFEGDNFHHSAQLFKGGFMENIDFQEKYLELDEQNKNLNLNIKTLSD